MVDESKKNIIADYDKLKGLCSDCCKVVNGLIEQLLAEEDVQIHSVVSRVKAKDSLINKIKLKGDGYKEINDITDIIGIRVITFFEDDVDNVASIIEKEFNIDKEKSTDVRKTQDSDKFGYISLHYISRLSEKRLELTENKRFASCVFEIQVRSILQHAWAEIEHDLGYKNKSDIPRDVRRRFSRIAGLLELADSEFNGIRLELEEYRFSVQQRIKSEPENILIDKDSLTEYIKTSNAIKELDERFVKGLDGELMYGYYNVNPCIEIVNYFGIKNIADLEKKLTENIEMIILFGDELLSERGDRKPSFAQGTVIFYLGYILALESGSKEKVVDYLTMRGLYDEASPDEEVLNRKIEIYKKIKS